MKRACQFVFLFLFVAGISGCGNQKHWYQGTWKPDISKGGNIITRLLSGQNKVVYEISDSEITGYFPEGGEYGRYRKVSAESKGEEREE